MSVIEKAFPLQQYRNILMFHKNLDLLEKLTVAQKSDTISLTLEVTVFKQVTSVTIEVAGIAALQEFTEHQVDI